jgi:predicted PhzF superfamily epimerase YddE/YHI9
MQALAQQFNLRDHFVLPSTGHGTRRIFTPAAELPFADIRRWVPPTSCAR